MSSKAQSLDSYFSILQKIIGVYSTCVNPHIALKRVETVSEEIADELKKIKIILKPTKTKGIVFSVVGQKKISQVLQTKRENGPAKGNIIYVGINFCRHMELHYSTHNLKNIRPKFHSLSPIIHWPDITVIAHLPESFPGCPPTKDTTHQPHAQVRISGTPEF